MTPKKPYLPVLFVGHGSPMNALAKNDYTAALAAIGKVIPVPQAVLSISAHWLTNGTFITSQASPKQIYDFNGFPDELYQVKYSAKGSPEIAAKIQELLRPTEIKPDNGEWGLDHGTWSVLQHLYPKANVPVLQLSLDIRQPPEYHLKLGEQLRVLRDEGILIVASGNIVHNLRAFSWKEDDEIFPWALEFDTWVKVQIEARNFTALALDYNKTPAGKMSVPSLDHYLPLLYILGASRPEDRLSFFFEKIQNSSIAMRSLIYN